MSLNHRLNNVYLIGEHHRQTEAVALPGNTVHSLDIYAQLYTKLKCT